MEIIEWISEHWGINPEIQRKIFFSLAAIFVLAFMRQLLLKVVFWRIKAVKQRYKWKNGVRYIFVFLSVMVISTIWIDEFHSIATFLGLISAGIAVALKDPIVNLAGWLFIMIRRPFEVGDRIQIMDFSGDVIDIRAFQFTLNEIGNWVDSDQSTGRIVHIPNGKVFSEAQFNYHQGFSNIWNEVCVVVTFESDWQKAKDILNRVLEKHTKHLTKSAQKKLMEASKKFMIFYNTLTPVIYTKVKDHGVALTMRYLCLPKKRRSTEHAIWEEILIEFRKHDDIDFAYPTKRIYYNKTESKQAMKEGR